MPSSKGFSHPGKIQLMSLMSPAFARGFFTTSTTWEAHQRLGLQLFLLGTKFNPEYQTFKEAGN